MSKEIKVSDEVQSIIDQYLLGKQFDLDGYEDLGRGIILNAIDKTCALKNANDRKFIADTLWPPKPPVEIIWN
jgi:hypothetical protein